MKKQQGTVIRTTGKRTTPSSKPPVSRWRRIFTFALLVLLLFAFLLRTAAALYWQSRFSGDFVFGDSRTYWDLARTVAEGTDYIYGTQGEFKVFRMPGYPALLSPLFLLCGPNPPLLLARGISVVLGTLTVAGVYLLAQELFRRRLVGLLAAAFVVFDPLQIVLSVLVLSEAAFGFCMILQLYFWVRLLRKTNHRFFDMVACGVLNVLCVYLRPSWLYFLPMAILILYLPTVFSKQDNSTRRSAGTLWFSLAMLPILVIGLLPWGWRNYRICGHFTMTTLQMGASLYDGWRPDADGGSDMQFVERFRASEPVDSPNYEYDVDQKMKQAALEWAQSHPGRVLELAAIKFVRLWNIWPNEPSFSFWPIKFAIFLSYVPVVLAALVGLWKVWNKGPEFRLLWIPALYITCLHLIFVASLRYRAPAMLVLTIPAAVALLYGIRFKARKTRKT